MQKLIALVGVAVILRLFVFIAVPFTTVSNISIHTTDIKGFTRTRALINACDYQITRYTKACFTVITIAAVRGEVAIFEKDLGSFETSRLQ